MLNIEEISKIEFIEYASPIYPDSKDITFTIYLDNEKYAQYDNLKINDIKGIDNIAEKIVDIANNINSEIVAIDGPFCVLNIYLKDGKVLNYNVYSSKDNVCFYDAISDFLSNIEVSI